MLIMRKKTLINILVEILYYLVIFAYLLIIKNIYSVAVSYDFRIFMVIALVIVGLMLIAGSHVNKYLGFVLCFIYTLYLVAQKTYYKGFSSYFRFSTAFELYDEVKEQGGAIKELFSTNDLIPFIILLVITIIFLVLRYVFKIKTKYKFYVRLSALLCFGMSFLFANNVSKEIKATAGTENFTIFSTDFYLYDTVNNPKAFVERFGLITFGYRDVQTVFESKKNINDYKEEIDEYFLNKENNDKVNEYTGLFKDKSLLVIQSESLINLGISEELTPTLYRMINSSIEVTDFNTPLLIGSTSDSEFMSNTSFIPEAEGYSVCYQYVNNTYPLTLGNLFRDNGYKTTAFHNNYAIYYNRATTFANYGYEFFDSYGLGLESESPDEAISEQIGWIDCERDKFMSFWVSYSGHQPYEEGGVGLTDENVNKVRELYPDLDDEYVYYLAKIMDFDKAVEQFLNIMEWMNRLDDVVVIIYGDHIAKGLDFGKGSNFEEVFNTNNEDNPIITYTPLFIYSNNFEHKKVEKYCTTLDLIPTIMNLWDISYENKYAFGNDILDDSYSGLCFDANGNIYNGDFYYNATNNDISVYNNYDKAKAEIIVDDFNKKRDICKKILKADYFAIEN